MVVGDIGAGLSVQAMDREEKKIAKMRERNSIRLERFMNARERTIGKDLGALKMQMEEKQKIKQLEKNLEDFAMAQQLKIANILEAREMEAKKLRKLQNDQLKKEWNVNIESRKNRNKRDLTPIDIEKCGMASLQKFSGEDFDIEERKRLQQFQMRKWIEDSIEAKNARAEAEKAEDIKYDQFMKYMTEVRRQTEDSEGGLRKEAEKASLKINQELAEIHRQKLAKEKAEEDAANKLEIEKMMADPILCEDATYVHNGSIRRDHFRGFSKGQLLQIAKENDSLIALKNNNLEDKKENERKEALKSYLLAKRLEEIELAQARDRKQAHKDNLAYNKSTEENRCKEKRDVSFGDFNEGLFSKFGTSFR